MSDADAATPIAAATENAGGIASATGSPIAHRDDEALDGSHGASDHGEDHGHDDHGHAEEPLGPIDWGMWFTGAAGVALGLVVAWVIALSTGFRLGA